MKLKTRIILTAALLGAAAVPLAKYFRQTTSELPARLTSAIIPAIRKELQHISPAATGFREMQQNHHRRLAALNISKDTFTIRTNTDTCKLSVSATQRPSVSPPIRGTDIPFQTKTIDPGTDYTVILPSGTRIQIPAHALTDQDGNEVSGPVDLVYREFTSAADILLAGIPMQYDTAGKAEYLESAGMFEIYARQDGKDLRLKEGKEMQVDLRHEEKYGNYNRYDWDSSSRQWTYKRSMPVTRTLDIDPGWIYGFLRLKRRGPEKADSLSAEERFNSLLYHGLKKADNPEVPVAYRSLYHFQRGIFIKGIKQPDKTILISFPQQRKSNLRRPETKYIDGMRLILDEEMTIKDFREQIGYIAWLDARLRTDESNGQMYLVLKGSTGFRELAVRPQGSALSGKGIRMGLNKFRMSRHFDKKDEELDEKAEKENRNYQNWITKRPRDSAYYVQQLLKSGLDSLDLFGNDSCLRALADKANKLLAVQQQSYKLVQRTFSVSGFGLYNCDQIRRLNSPVESQVAFQDDQGNEVIPACMYLIDPSINSVLTFHYYEGTTRFSYSARAESMLILMLHGGKVCIVDKTQFAEEIKRKKAPTVTVSLANPELLTAENLRAMMK